MMAAIRTVAMMIHMVTRRVVMEAMLPISDSRVPGSAGNHVGHSERGPRGGRSHAPPITTNMAFWLVVARSHVVRDPPRIETCASTPRLWSDLGIRDALRSPR